MIKLEKPLASGWMAAVRGLRNPMNSWEKSDSVFKVDDGPIGIDILGRPVELSGDIKWRSLGFETVIIGEKDHDLMMRMARGGSDEAKFRRMINVTVDITAPLYWWKEFDTYKVGTVANSCSTMHKIHDKEFTLEDFSCEHLLCYDKDSGEDENGKFKPYTNAFVPIDGRLAMDTEGDMNHYTLLYIYPLEHLKLTIELLNNAREYFIKTHDKIWWWQMIQLLPSSYNQKRTVQLNYEVLAGIYPKRKEHKLDEWRGFCEWIKMLPYSEIITLLNK